MRTVLFLLLTLNLAAHAQTKPIQQPAATQEDFAYLRKYLETTHPMLYMHHSRPSMQHTMDSLAESLHHPLPFLEFYKKIAFLIARVGCEHTTCNYGEGFDKMIQNAGLFPYQLLFRPDKALVIVNMTADKDVQPGDEVLTINSYPIDSIRNVLYQYIPADGTNTSAKDMQLSSMAFNAWYYLFIEQTSQFTISFRTTDGRVFTKTVKADKIPSLNKKAVKNTVNKPVLELSKKLETWRKQPLYLELFPEKKAAVLTVNSFSVDMTKFRTTIDSFFRVLSSNKTQKLIIDVSYNGGGEVELAADLLNYFIKEPTRIVDYSYAITDRDEDLQLANLPDEILQSKYDFIEPLKDGKSFAKPSKYAGELKTLVPRPEPFNGKVYLYANGATASAAATFTAVMKSLNLATIVGQETGGSYTGGGTAFGLDLKLPQSGITAHTGLIYQRFQTKGGDSSRGVQPDIPYVEPLEKLIANDKPWRNFILELP